MTSVDLGTPTRALAVGAHPDDVEFGCGATLAKWALAGCEVHVAAVTDGSKGTWDPDTDASALARARADEAHRAAATLGAARVHHLGFVDAELTGSEAERRALCALVRHTRPEVVLGHDPWKRYRLHPDHRRAGFALLDAIVAARDPHFYPDLGAPHRPRRLLLFEAEIVDHVETVDETLPAKVQALLAHRSQWRSTMGIEAGSPGEADQRSAFADRLVDQARDAGVAAGVAGPVEAFKLLEGL